MPKPEPISVDLELVCDEPCQGVAHGQRDDSPIIPVTGPEQELVGVSLELAYAVFVDAIRTAQGDFGFSLLDPRRSGDANVLGANDRAHLHGYANDPGGNDRTLNPGRNLARNRNRDGDGGRKKETENPGLGGFLTT